MNLFDYLFAFVPMLGVLIFVHELGHFLVAKACGVRVLKFSLGFGSPIGIGNWRMRWERGGTEYVVAWIPLGGYVKMLGEQMAGVQGEELDIVADAAPDEYLNAKPTWQKLAITFAGPIMNLLLPVVIFVGLLAVGLPQPSPVIGTVEADSPAREAGLRVGDEVLAVDDQSVDSWDVIDMWVRDHAGRTVMFDVARSGETLRIGVPVSGRSGLDGFGDVIDIGWAGIGHRRLPSLLGIGTSGTEASRAGLLSGDRVLRVGGVGAAGQAGAASEKAGAANEKAGAAGEKAGAASEKDGREVEDWRQLQDAYAAVAAEGQGETVFRVARLVEEQTQEIDITVPVLEDLADLGVIPAAILVRSVSEGMPADEAGLEPGDLILGVDGEPVGSFDTFAEIVRSSEGRSLLLAYSRKGVPHEVEIAARESVIPSPLQIEGMEQKGYLIGVSPAIATLPGASHIEKVLNPFVSFPRAFMMTVDVSAHFLQGMKKLFSGNVGLDNVAGPIGIAEIARKSLDLGWMTYLSTLILISINLGFLNLLPIPILDGGQALIYAVEGIKRSPISMRSREIVQQIGLTMIMMLMGLAFWNDLSRHWSQFLEWLGAGL